MSPTTCMLGSSCSGTRSSWCVGCSAWQPSAMLLNQSPSVSAAQIGYFILILGGFGVFLWKAYPRIPNDYIAAWHKPIGIGVMLACLSSFIAAAAVHPGHITKDTVARYARWKFDNILFDKRVCATCDVVKPARRSVHAVVPRAAHSQHLALRNTPPASTASIARS